MLEGLRSIIYPSKDLVSDKAFWTKALGIPPYFDQDFYVGFNVGGYELGLDPNGGSEENTGPVTYWGCSDIAATAQDLAGKGITQQDEIHNVGEDILMATFLDDAGFTFGIIQNPHFESAETTTEADLL